jgi:hypothetical protein
MTLKLPALPDRTPHKLVLHVEPALLQRLQLYADAYAQNYARTETISMLSVKMLEAFLNSDSVFRKFEHTSSQRRAAKSSARTTIAVQANPSPSPPHAS